MGRVDRRIAERVSGSVPGRARPALTQELAGHVKSIMTDRFLPERHRMVEEQIRRRGLHDDRLLGVLRSVPRHLFVPWPSRDAAYDDTPLPLGSGQTISQPYIVALMTSLLQLRGDERALEVGTGSGYQAAILSHLTQEVHTIELLPQLAARAARLLKRLKCDNVHVHVADGSVGWPDASPFSAVLVAAAAQSVPQPLLEQLADGGRLVIPIESRRRQPAPHSDPDSGRQNHGTGHRQRRVRAAQGQVWGAMRVVADPPRAPP